MRKIRNRYVAWLMLGLLAMTGCAPVYLSRRPAGSEPLVRIAMQRRQPRAVVYGSYRIMARGDGSPGGIGPGESWTVSRSGDRLDVETGAGAFSLSGNRLRLWSDGEFFVNDKMVRGTIEIIPEAGAGLLVVAEMPLEDYLPGVLAAEIGGLADRFPEAARAQAVVSRGYAFTKIRANPTSDYDIEAGTAHQCFDLDRLASPAVRRAVADTRGQVLTYQANVISPNFHSTCGGRTARPSEVWNARDEDFPYLEPVQDRWCDISPKHSWTDTVRLQDISDKVFPGRAVVLKDVKIDSRGASGRVTALRLSTGTGDTVLTRTAVRNGLREKPLLSTWFDMVIERNNGGDVARIILGGKGYGHGVGLCQWGAIGMARSGKSYKSILKHYYRGVEIERAY